MKSAELTEIDAQLQAVTKLETTLMQPTKTGLFAKQCAMSHRVSTSIIRKLLVDWTIVAKRIRRVHNGHARAHNLS